MDSLTQPELTDEQIENAVNEMLEMITAPVREITACQKTQRKIAL